MRTFLCTAVAFVVASSVCSDLCFGRGFGGARTGGFRGGTSRGGSSSRFGSSPVRAQPVRTPSYSGGRQSTGRTATGSRGGSITIGGTRGHARGPGGSAAGRAGGVQVTTPSGRTVTKGGASGAIRTPSGGAAGQARGGSASGPRGSMSGVQGRGAGHSFATDAGLSRYAGGAAVRGSRGAVAGHSTRAAAVSTRHGHAAVVRRDVHRGHVGYHHWFGPGWHNAHPGCWHARRWTAGTVWIAVSWRSLVGYWGWQSAPTYYYDYGNTVVYEGDTVYYDSKPAATAEEYYEQASAISKRGEAKADEDEDWKSLGVWAMVQDGQTESNKILQLAVNKEGIIRGSHYDALTEATMLIQGAVDQKTQRAAWTIGDNGSIVYETGIFNLTQTETEMLIHFGKDSTQQWSLVRLEAPDQDDSSE